MHELYLQFEQLLDFFVFFSLLPAAVRQTEVVARATRDQIFVHKTRFSICCEAVDQRSSLVNGNRITIGH